MGLIKNMIQKFKNTLLNGNKKKLVENFVIVLIIGIIVIIAGGTLFRGNGQAKQNNPAQDDESIKSVNKTVQAGEEQGLEEKLAHILSQMEGAGRVDVMITYESGSEIVPAYDTKKNQNSTEEKDSGGGTRSISQEDSENSIVYEQEQGGARKPVVIKSIYPTVQGVVVVADGAAEPVVKERLCAAVQVLMDIEAHRVQVFERKK